MLVYLAKIYIIKSEVKKINLYINNDKFRYMLIFREQIPGSNSKTKVSNKSFEKVARFIYLVTTINMLKLY